MSPEIKENEISPVTIEFSGTPFPARRKLLVHNAIEDMLWERTGIKVDGRFGLSENFLPTSIRGSELIDYHEGISRVRNLLYKGRPPSGPFIIQDGAFSVMVYTEFLKRAGVFSKDEARDHINGLKPFIKMEDLIILNMIRPRAALTRELFPKSLDIDGSYFQRRFISYSLFNESLEKILHDLSPKLPQIVKVEPPGDDFAAIDIFFTNADIVFSYLGLPTTEEWDKYLRNHPEHKNSHLPSFSGRSLAGLNSQEIIQAINDWDWSKQPDKKARVENMAYQITNILEEKGVIPPKKSVKDF